MIIAGAKGLAKEVLDVMSQLGKLDNLFFFDNVSDDASDKLFNRFPILRTLDEANVVFQQGDPTFTLGLGNPIFRHRLENLLSSVGGSLTSAISPASHVGAYGNSIGLGCTILPGAVITCGVNMGKGCLINPHSSISHDAQLGDFVELGPGARITGHVVVGDYTVIGTNAVILPRIKIGRNVLVGAGAVVSRDVEDNTVVAGVPARPLRKQVPLSLDALR